MNVLKCSSYDEIVDKNEKMKEYDKFIKRVKEMVEQCEGKEGD